MYSNWNLGSSKKISWAMVITRDLKIHGDNGKGWGLQAQLGEPLEFIVRREDGRKGSAVNAESIHSFIY